MAAPIAMAFLGVYLRVRRLLRKVCPCQVGLRPMGMIRVMVDSTVRSSSDLWRSRTRRKLSVFLC